MKILKGHTSRINDLAFSPDGSLLASCSTDGTLRLWDTLSGEGHLLEPGREAASPGVFQAVGFSTDGQSLLAQPRWGWLQVWSVADGRRVTTPLPGSSDRWGLSGFAVSPRGDVIAATESGSASSQSLRHALLHLWDCRTWKKERIDLGTYDQARGVCFDPTGTRLATESGLYDLGRRAIVGRTKFHADQLKWSPTAPLLAGSMRNLIALWDPRSRRLLRKLYLDRKEVQDFAFSPDGAYLAAVSNEEIVRIWDTRHWAEREGYAWQIGELKCLAFAADGQRAACGSQKGTILVWDWDL